MPRARAAVVLSILACALLAPAAPAQAVAPNTAMIREINQFRAAHGRSHLRVSDRLNRSSSRYSRYLMRRGLFVHSGIRAGGPFRATGEVLEIHRGRRPTIRRALRSWARSPSHRAILLSSTYRLVGAGYTRGTYHGIRAGLWVVHVARRK